MKIDFEKLLQLFAQCIIVFAAFVAVSSLSFCLYKNLTTPNTVDFCYLKRSNNLTILVANIEWHADEEIEFFGTTKAAKEAADLISCPLNIQKIEFKTQNK